MKKNNTVIFVTLLISLLTLPVRGTAQYYYGYVHPRVLLGTSGAYYRISAGDFEKVYTSRWGESFGGFAGIRVYKAYYLTAKYRTFQKSGKQGVHEKSGLDLRDARWNEQWITAGVRVNPPITRKTISYYGFGLIFFDVDEEPGLSIFNDTQNEKNWGNGFFMELGVEYFPFERLYGFFEVEISSGGTRGKTGFEAFSVGGFRFAAGIGFWPF
ncbi:hypothetical protein JW935_24445 [candidate division KSB1 bacterium]|nr:hypothetical protein [candidate division KSB1 bacterium]